MAHSSTRLVTRLIRPQGSRGSIYASWVALCVGLLLLFIAVLAWVDFREILNGKARNDAMATYITIGKKITNRSMRQDLSQNLFSDEEIAALKRLDNVVAVAKITANQFPVTAEIGGAMGFRTALFLESVADSFLDHPPDGWRWKPGDQSVPVLLSTEFLHLYNYGFALSQGLPQLSAESIKALPFQITIANGAVVFRAQVIGFTDRINAALVPEQFMSTMNQQYGSAALSAPARLLLKVKDPSDKAFVDQLTRRQYTVNEDQLRWSRIQTAVQIVVSIVGVIAVLIVGIALLSFILFLRLTVYRAADNIRRLIQIGYAPHQLRRVLQRFFLPWMGAAALAAAIIAFLLHLLLIRQAAMRNLDIPIGASGVLIIPFLALLLLFFVLIQYAIRSTLKKL